MRTTLDLCFGVVSCAGLAGLLSLLLNDGTASKYVAPLLCLQAVMIASLFFGRLSGVAGGIAANVTFAIWLCPPIGSIGVKEPVDWIMLLIFQMSALCVVLLSPRNRSRSGILRRRQDGTASEWQGR